MGTLLESALLQSPPVSRMLQLDPAIRDWVLIPVMVVMILVGVLRDKVTRLMRSITPGKLDALREQQILKRAQILRTNYKYIPAASFARRRHDVIKNYLSQAKKKNPMDAMAQMQDPNMMQNMMKQNMVMIVPQMAMMGWVSYFFAGFVVGKIPFPLTERFKMMLQRGIELSSLDVEFVSSLSLYFLIMFGLRGVFQLILGQNDDTDDAKVMQQQMQGGGMQQGQDMQKVFETEKNQLELVGWEDGLARCNANIEAAIAAM